MGNIDHAYATNGFADQLRLNWRVITAVVLRETKTRFGRYKFGYAWALVEPIVYVTLFVGIRSFMPSGQVSHQIIVFVITALLTFRMFSAISSTAMNAIGSNSAILAFPPVKPMDCIIARVILETLTMVVIWVVFYTALQMVSEVRVIVDFRTLCAAFFATALLGAGVGTLNAVVSTLYPFWDRIWGMTKLPLFISSGVFYSPSQLPANVANIMMWNPVAHCIEWTRLSTQFAYHPMLDKTYVIVFGVVTLCLGCLLERMFRYRLLSQ